MTEFEPLIILSESQLFSKKIFLHVMHTDAHKTVCCYWYLRTCTDTKSKLKYVFIFVWKKHQEIELLWRFVVPLCTKMALETMSLGQLTTSAYTNTLNNRCKRLSTNNNLFTSLIILIETLGNIEINECLQFYDKWAEFGCRGGKVTTCQFT